MFSGIVEEVGHITRVESRDGLTVLTVGAQQVLEGTRVGDSLAVNGVCLTVTHLTASEFTVDVMPETLRRTNLGGLTVGQEVNLERSLALGDRIGGHFVQGHVDGVGTVRARRPDGEAAIVEFTAPEGIMKYVVPKGFIAVDGVSLTVVERWGDGFSVAFIPHTLAHTIAGAYQVGTVVNLEADILGKYVEQLLAAQVRAEQQEQM
ncbi:MAG: riboflavin synthase [Ardenticatenia bacterium]|nr:riboflavin synthase [Ardenticatenia bacterium]